jgi:predicted RNase H-like HicB family nuclease
MHHAHYELLPDNEGFYGEVENLPGVWAQAPTLETCREELQNVLEGWILLALRLGH